ncbi:MAG: helicase-associated domain-containing protein [Chloroflexi bacterium]|nr:helicase-associated domain-containing protein [Chloroflexota bacterium]OJW06214.1 MAG: hypothetical protein BGO39_25545 [Chloroflexi bacterium 54-19]
MQNIFELLFDQLDKLQDASPGQRPLSPHLETLGKLPPYAFKRILEGYSVGALQVMAAARGLDTQRKRAQLEQDLLKTFNDTAAVKRALERLSPAGREGLFHLKRMGGLVSLETWRATMVNRYGKEVTEQTQAELVGNLLAVYATVHTYGVEFNFPYKNELTMVGSYGSPVNLLLHPKAVGLFQPTPAEEKAYLQRDTLKPFTDPEPAPPTTPGFDSLLADLVGITRYFEQNKVKALVSGEPGKRDYQKLNEGLSVKEPGDVKAAKKMEELGRLYFLWTLLKETKIVSLNPSNDLFQVNQAASEEFFALPRYRQARLLLGAWVRSGFNEFRRIPTLHFYRMSYYETSLPDTVKTTQARFFLLGLLDFYRRQESLLPEVWLDFPRLVRAVRDLDTAFLVDHDNSANQYRQGYRYEYDYDPVFPSQGYFGDEYYAGFTSSLKLAPPKSKGVRLAAEILGAPLKLGEDFALVEGEWLAQVIAEPLSWLGIAELARDDKGRPVAFRLTDLGLAALADRPSERERQQTEIHRQVSAQSPDLTKALLVQPNFDVMVLAPLENLALLRQVDRFADQTSMGDVALYRITKDSVLRGLRSGLRGDEISTTLQDNSRVPVASNVLQSLGDWAAEFERLVLYESCEVLETPDSATLDRLLAQPDAARHVIKRLGPTFALVKPVRGAAGNGLEPTNISSAARNGGLPLYLDYQALRPGSVSFEGPFLLKVKPGAGNPYLYYRLGQFADLESYAPQKFTATFRLTAAAGQRAQQQGLTFESVIKFLEMVLPQPARRGKSSVDPVAPDTLLALKGWLGYYSPLQAEPALTIQSTQAAQLRDIFQLEEFQSALLGWAGPNIALVRQGEYEEVAARLADLGMPVNGPGETPTFEETLANEKPRRGKRSGPEETVAERERKAREKKEAEQRAQPNLREKLAQQNGRNALNLDSILDLMDMVAGHGVAPEELERLLEDLEDNPDLLWGNRVRRKRPWDY